ncbi:protein SNORC isoform X2 [Apteryx rowi]|nr:protein SNORC isoform X2 [Apteryx rowi]
MEREREREREFVVNRCWSKPKCHTDTDFRAPSGQELSFEIIPGAKTDPKLDSRQFSSRNNKQTHRMWSNNCCFIPSLERSSCGRFSVIKNTLSQYPFGGEREWPRLAGRKCLFSSDLRKVLVLCLAEESLLEDYYQVLIGNSAKGEHTRLLVCR